MLPGARVQKLGPAAHHHESQQFPVFGVSVRDERYFWVLEDVPDAFESGYGTSFGFSSRAMKIEARVRAKHTGTACGLPIPSEVARRATLWRTRKAA